MKIATGDFSSAVNRSHSLSLNAAQLGTQIDEKILFDARTNILNINTKYLKASSLKFRADPNQFQIEPPNWAPSEVRRSAIPHPPNQPNLLDQHPQPGPLI